MLANREKTLDLFVRPAAMFQRWLSLVALLGGVAMAGTATAAVAESTFESLRFRLVGPAHMSGRVTDIAVHPGQKRVVYCGTATGGVWKTENQGTTWRPVFDDAGTSSIGAIAVAPSDPEVVWVGTGEANASSYSSWGDGVYKSTNGGQTWTHMGLGDTHHIGRIVIHPRDPDVVYVAALGHLWGRNSERGLYKTEDGGQTWSMSKFISDRVGFVDVAMDRSDPRVLYAAAYGRRADRFDDFDSVGIYVEEEGGIWKSVDAGTTWVPLTDGLPSERVGRIGLSVAPTRSDRIYAIIEVAPVWATLEEPDLARIRVLLSGSTEPTTVEREGLLQRIKDATPPGDPPVWVAGLSRSEQFQLRMLLGQQALDTGGGVFRSDDAGATWQRMNALNEREAYYSQIRVDPQDPDRVYALMVRTWVSTDAGQTFEQTDWAFSSFLSSDFIHGDFHALWIDPDSPERLIVGSDGGLYSSYDRGDHWEAHPLPIGQFVAIAVDQRRPYYIYGGLQDNGTWAGPSATRHRSGVTDGDWFKIQSADGGYAQVDPSDPNVVYTESQYANIQRVNLATGVRRSIRPTSSTDEPALRFNYTTPYFISPHDSATLYLGAQRVLKSTDRGDHWTAVSPDLSKQTPNPDTREGATITTLSESPVKAGVLWAGTDDGNLQLSRDGGANWSSVVEGVAGLPTGDRGLPRTWVSRIEASYFEAGTAYVGFDAHRDDDFGVYLYRTSDFGRTWHSIAANLPDGAPVNVVRADRRNPKLLFVGTEAAVHVSIDEGAHWVRLKNGLPTVPIDDLLIHARDGELVVGTHGRGIYVLDIRPLQELTHNIFSSEMHLFSIRPATLLRLDVTRNKGASGARRFATPNPYGELVMESDGSGLAPPGATISYYLLRAHASVAIRIHDAQGQLVRELTGSGSAGIQSVSWDLRTAPRDRLPAWRRVGGNDSRRLARTASTSPGALVPAGEYEVRVSVDGVEATALLRVEPDTWTNR